MTITKELVQLVKDYNSTVSALFIDPFFINLVHNYLDLLDGEEWDVHEISDSEYVRTVLNENELNPKVKKILMVKDPIGYVRTGIEKICDAIPLYLSYRDDGLTPKDLRNSEYNEMKKMPTKVKIINDRTAADIEKEKSLKLAEDEESKQSNEKIKRKNRRMIIISVLAYVMMLALILLFLKNCVPATEITMFTVFFIAVAIATFLIFFMGVTVFYDESFFCENNTKRYLDWLQDTEKLLSLQNVLSVNSNCGNCNVTYADENGKVSELVIISNIKRETNINVTETEIRVTATDIKIITPYKE